jgi:hypothetical protein
MDNDLGIVFELSLFATNIKEVCNVLQSFLCFFFKFEEKNLHNVLCLMLNPKFKSICLVFLFIGHEKGVNIVGKYYR